MRRLKATHIATVLLLLLGLTALPVGRLACLATCKAAIAAKSHAAPSEPAASHCHEAATAADAPFHLSSANACVTHADNQRVASPFRLGPASNRVGAEAATPFAPPVSRWVSRPLGPYPGPPVPLQGRRLTLVTLRI